MADDEIRMSDSSSSDATLQGLIAQLINGMSMTNTQIRQLTSEVRSLIGTQSKRSDEKELSTTIKGLQREIESLDRSIERSRSDITNRRDNTDIAISSLKAVKIDFEKSLKGAKSDLIDALKKLEELKSEGKDTTIQRATITSLETTIRDFEDRIQRITPLIDNINNSSQVVQEFTDIISNSTQVVDNFSGSTVKRAKTEEDIFKEEKEAAIQRLEIGKKQSQRRAEQLRRELADLKELDGENREAIELKQKEIDKADEAIETQERATKALEKLTYSGKKAAEIWGETREGIKKTFKDLPSQLVSGITKWGIFDRIEATLQSGFDKVYQSVETTRNQISARSRLDQGAFTDLQNEIKEQIKLQGLEGVVNQVDVNEAIANLSAAGITDKELLKNLALEQAKAQAMGSSLDLTNEGTIQSIIGQLSAGTSWTDIQGVIEATRAEELALREQYGHSYALERGGLTRIFEEGLSKATAYGLSAKDYITSSAVSQQAAGSMGLDPTIFQKTLDAIENNTISNQSTFGQILAQNGLTAESFKTMSQQEQYARMQSVYEQYLRNANENTIQYIQQVLGFDATNRELFTMARTIKEQGSLNLAQKVDYAANDKLLKDYESQAKKGDFISKTEYDTNKQLNIIAEQAIAADELYKGDQLYHSVTDPILGGLTSAANSIITAILTTGGQGIGNLLPSGAKASTKAGFENFMTGASGTKLGNLGKIAGGAIGVGQMGISAYKNFKNSAGFESGLVATLEDNDTIKGAMMTVGSAVAGPIGGMVGELSAGIGGAIGNAIPQGVKDALGFVALNALPFGNLLTLSNSDKGFEEYNETFSELDLAATKLLESANAQLSAVDSQLSTFESFDTDQQKLYLLENGLMSAQDLQNKSATEINEEFKKLIIQQLENERKKAEDEARRAATLKASASGIADFKSNFKQISKASTEHGEMGQSDQEKMITSMLGGAQAASGIIDYVLASDSINTGIEELFKDANLSDKEKETLSRYMEEIKGRKYQYQSANDKFHEKWNQAASQANSSSLADIMVAYTNMFNVVPRIKKDTSGNYVLDGGLPVLEDSNGLYYTQKFSEANGNFKTGLTRVPYDGYNAILHEGERILTKEEASSYNNLVSYMIDNAVHTSTSNSDVEQIFTDSIINGNSDVKESITNQTETLSAKMDSLINLVAELMNALRTAKISGKDLSAVLKMNSNVMQLNTAL